MRYQSDLVPNLYCSVCPFIIVLQNSKHCKVLLIWIPLRIIISNSYPRACSSITNRPVIAQTALLENSFCKSLTHLQNLTIINTKTTLKSHILESNQLEFGFDMWVVPNQRHPPGSWWVHRELGEVAGGSGKCQLSYTIVHSLQQ